MTTPRLTPDQVADYQDQGYLLYEQPVLQPERFASLAACFEGLLAAKPAEIRPEAMDVPHFAHPELFEWLFDDDVLDLVEPLIGPNIALFSSHFICKPEGDGKRVPWHEDSAYWKGMMEPIEVVTVWLAIDPSTPANGCMYVIPKTHREGRAGFSDYDPVDAATHVFGTEITRTQRNDSLAVACQLEPNHASLHDGRLIHGSPPNISSQRRCGYTMRYMPTTVKLNPARCDNTHLIYLARGRDHAGNTYGDPTRSYEELARYREAHGRRGH